MRTLRDLGVGLDDIKRVLTVEASLVEVAAEHTRAIGAQIGMLRLQRAVLRAVARSTDPKELERMTDLTTLTADERRRIVDDYLEAVFGDDPNAVAEKLRMGTPELPEDPTPDQVAAWVEVAELLRDPGFVATSRRMAQRALAEGPEPDVVQFQVGKAVGEHAGAALRSGVDPGSPEALAVIERLEASAPSRRRTVRGSLTGSRRSATAEWAAIGRSWGLSTTGPPPRHPTTSWTRGIGTPAPFAPTHSAGPGSALVTARSGGRPGRPAVRRPTLGGCHEG